MPIPQAHGVEKTGAAGRPSNVGRYSHGNKIVFEGNQTFTSAALKHGLLKSSNFLMAAYPSEPFDTFLKTLQNCLKRGYGQGGFPDTRVEVDYDGKGDVVEVKIVEGPRYRWGVLRIEGLKSINAAEFTREFLQNAGQPDTFGRRISQAVGMMSVSEKFFDGPMPQLPGTKEDPISVKNLVGDKVALAQISDYKVWTAGETASFGPEADGALKERIIQHLRWKGVSAREVTISHKRQVASGVADTEVRIEEGPPVTLHAITLKGNEAFTREEMLKFLGLREGMTVADDIISQVEDRLARSMRFIRWRALLVAAKNGIELCLGVQELPNALPLEQPLNEDQEEFVRMSEWVTTMDKRDTTLETGVILADGTPEPKSPFRFNWASQKGIQFTVKGPVLDGQTTSFAITLVRNGLTALLDENKQRTIWHTAAAAANVEAGVMFMTKMDEQGKPFGEITPYGGLRGIMMDEPRLKLRVLITPTEFYRMATRPGSTVRRIHEEGVKCLEIVYNEIRFLWDISRQQLRECRIPLDDASKGKERRFVQVRQSTEEWRALETEFAHAANGEDVPSGSFSDWAGLLLRLPDLESKTQGLLTHEVVERSALLLDLSNHLLVTLLDAWHASSKSKDLFIIPFEPLGDGTPLVNTSLLADVWFRMADVFLPPESWLWDLGREAFYAEMGHRQGTQAAMQRIAQDPAIGPYGALLAEVILNKLNLPQAILFRRLAAQRLSAEHLRQDWEMLFRAPVGLQESVDDVFKHLAILDDRQLRLLDGTGGLALGKPLIEAAKRLRNTPGTRPAELLWPVAESWWKSSGQEEFKKRLGPISRLLPPDPALVAARVNDTDITRAEVWSAAREQEQIIRRSLGDRPAEMDRQVALLHEKTMEQLIQRTVMIEAFDKSGGTIQDELIDKDVESVVTQMFEGDRAAFLQALSAEGITLQQFRKGRRDMLITLYVRNQLVAELKEPGEEDLRAAYEAHKANNRARHVHLHAITIPKNAPDAKKLATDLHARAIKGEDFEHLAKAHSTDENADNGGCRGNIDPTELYKPLQDALQTMKAGDVSTVLEIETVFVLLWIKDEKPVKPPSFEKERPRLLEEVRRKQQDDLVKRWTDEKRKAAYVEILPTP